MISTITRIIVLFSGILVLFTADYAKNHAQAVADHSSYLKGPYKDGTDVTKDCLKCHEKEGKDILKSAHWLWKGPTPFIEGHEDAIDLGKKNLINNF